MNSQRSFTLDSIKVLFQDKHMVAVDKPPGLLVHRSMIAKYETQFALQMVRDKLNKRVYPVHRLDRPTSGVLLFAFDSNVAAKLTQQFTNRDVKKRYLAVVRGHCVNSYHIDYPLVEQQDQYTDHKARSDKPAQSAISELNCLSRYDIPLPAGRYQTARFSLIELLPLTGRKHQLRRHMAHIRHPILGDTTHGDGKQNKFARHHFNFASLALTCTNIRLSHPVEQTELEIQTNVHTDFEKLLRDWQLFEVPGNENLLTHKVVTS